MNFTKSSKQRALTSSCGTTLFSKVDCNKVQGYSASLCMSGDLASANLWRNTYNNALITMTAIISLLSCGPHKRDKVSFLSVLPSHAQGPAHAPADVNSPGVCERESQARVCIRPKRPLHLTPYPSDLPQDKVPQLLSTRTI